MLHVALHLQNPQNVTVLWNLTWLNISFKYLFPFTLVLVLPHQRRFNNIPDAVQTLCDLPSFKREPCGRFQFELNNRLVTGGGTFTSRKPVWCPNCNTGNNERRANKSIVEFQIGHPKNKQLWFVVKQKNAGEKT